MSHAARSMPPAHASRDEAPGSALQEVQGLATALEATPPHFVLELAMLAARSGHLDLQSWLQERLAERGTAFCQVPAHPSAGWHIM